MLARPHLKYYYMECNLCRIVSKNHFSLIEFLFRDDYLLESRSLKFCNNLIFDIKKVGYKVDAFLCLPLTLTVIRNTREEVFLFFKYFIGDKSNDKIKHV